MRERVKGGGARAPPWARVCARGVPLLSTALLVLNRCPGRGAPLCEGARSILAPARGGVWVYESRWHSSQRGRCVTWGRRRAAGGDTDRARRLLMCCVCCARVWRLSRVPEPRRVSAKRVESSVEPNVAGLRTQLRTECSAPECSEVIFSKVGVALTFTRVIARLPDHTGVDTRGQPGSGRSASLDYMSIISEIRTCNHAQLHAIMHSCRSRAHRGTFTCASRPARSRRPSRSPWRQHTRLPTGRTADPAWPP